MTVSLVTITNDPKDPQWKPFPFNVVRIVLNGGPRFDDDGREVAAATTVNTDAAGNFSVALEPNAGALAGTSYTIKSPWSTWTAVIPAVPNPDSADGSYTLNQVLAIPPDAPEAAFVVVRADVDQTSVLTDEQKQVARQNIGVTDAQAAVNSFAGRTGVIVPQAGDYTPADVGADPVGAADTAQANAEAYADAKVSALGTAATHAATDFDPAGSATTAQAAAEGYTDSRITGLGLGTAATHAAADFDTAGSAASALSSAKTYTDAETARAEAVEATKADLVGGVIPTSQIPAVALFDVVSVANQTAMLALPAGHPYLAVRADNGSRYILDASKSPAVLANWVLIDVDPSAAVNTVNGQAGTVVLAAADVGADPTGAASAAQVNAESYTDSKIAGLGSAATHAATDFDAAGSASAAQANAQTFATNAVNAEASRAEAVEAGLAPGTQGVTLDYSEDIANTAWPLAVSGLTRLSITVSVPATTSDVWLHWSADVQITTGGAGAIFVAPGDTTNGADPAALCSGGGVGGTFSAGAGSQYVHISGSVNVYASDTPRTFRLYGDIIRDTSSPLAASIRASGVAPYYTFKPWLRAVQQA